MAEHKDYEYGVDDDMRLAETDFKKCPGCGANMEFDPATQTLLCPFCGNIVDFEKDRNVREKDISDAFALAEKWDEASVVACENCGAKFVISSNEVATECPYCGTSHVRKVSDLAGIKPNALYPFMLTPAQAEVLAKKWAKRRLFAPKRFKKNVEARNLKGVYEPCFTFDSDTFSVYDGKLGKHKTRTVKTKDGMRTETYIEWRHVNGTFSHFFDDITITAGEILNQRLYSKLKPFDLSTIRVYNKDYLAGYSANHYEKDLKTAWDESKDYMDEMIRRLIVDKYNCDVVGYLNVRTSHNNPTYKYVLMPLYLLNYRYRKKDYRVNVNGSTGKIAGKTPVSPLRVFIAVIIGLALIIGSYLLFTADGCSSKDRHSAVSAACCELCEEDFSVSLTDTF